MRIQGGKARLGKAISQVLKQQAEEYENLLKKRSAKKLAYFEPFAGMLGVMRHMNDEGRVRHANDINQDTVAMWKAVQRGWRPKSTCTQRDWDKAKQSHGPSAERGFIGSQCSFGGAFFSGFAGKYDKTDKNYAQAGLTSLEKILPDVKDVRFTALSYEDFEPSGMLIYADPPYASPYQSVQPNKYMRQFDHDKFWKTMQEWSKRNLVFVSEYKAPQGWKSIWKKILPKAFNQKQSKDNGYKTNQSVEQVFFFSAPESSRVFANPMLGKKRARRAYDSPQAQRRSKG